MPSHWSWTGAWLRLWRNMIGSCLHSYIVFVDTTSTYWDVDGADEPAELQPEPEPADGTCKPVENGPAASASPRTIAMTCRRW